MYRHLSLTDRCIIASYLKTGLRISEIAKKLDRNPSTISREIKKHRYIKKHNRASTYNDCTQRQTCNKAEKCNYGFTSIKCRSCENREKHCKYYKSILCEKLSRGYLVCNGCEEYRSCIKDKYLYDAQRAQNIYEITRSDSRAGISIEEADLIELDQFLTPLITQGQSMYGAVTGSSRKINLSISTLYNYQSQGILRLGGNVTPRKIRFKNRSARSRQPKQKKERVDRVNYGYEAYENFIKQNPKTSVVEMDIVESKKGGKVLLTFLVKNTRLFMAFLLNRATQDAVKEKIDWIENTLGTKRFRRLFEVILTDNGSEFINPDKITLNKDNKSRTKLFYCNPYAAYQKGSLENTHTLVRRIIPKGISINHLTQKDIDLMVSHINSYPRNSLKGNSAYISTKQLYGTAYLNLLNIDLIQHSDIQLKPDLIGLSKKMKLLAE